MPERVGINLQAVVEDPTLLSHCFSPDEFLLEGDYMATVRFIIKVRTPAAQSWYPTSPLIE